MPALSVFGSTRTTVAFPHATHTAPSPYAIASAFRHTGIVATILRRWRSTRITEPSTALIQRAPPPSATSVGFGGTWPAARLAFVASCNEFVRRPVRVETRATRLAMLPTQYAALSSATIRSP